MILRAFPVILLLSALTSGVRARMIPEISGYYEPQYMLAGLDSDWYNIISNKIRLDLDIDITENISFGMNYNFLVYSGNIDWNLLDLVPGRVSDAIPAADRQYYKFEYENDSLLDNIFLKLSPEFADITIGKQQISVGTGYAWNPTDVFNKKETFDPTYEQTGRYAVRADVPIAERTTAVMVYGSDDDFKNFTKLFKVKSGYSRYDFSVTAIDTFANINDFVNFTESKPRRILLGGDLVGELLGLGVWCEYAYNIVKHNPDYYESLAGFDYTFTGGMYAMGEYFRNSSAKTDYKDYTLNDWLEYLSADRRSVSRDQLYILVTLPATDLISVGASAIISLNDSSISIIPNLDYSLSQNIQLQIIINASMGRSGTVYDNSLGTGGIVRMRYYF